MKTRLLRDTIPLVVLKTELHTYIAQKSYIYIVGANVGMLILLHFREKRSLFILFLVMIDRYHNFVWFGSGNQQAWLGHPGGLRYSAGLFK